MIITAKIRRWAKLFLGRMAGESLSSLFFEFGETNEVQKKNKHMHGGVTAAVDAVLAASALCGG